LKRRIVRGHAAGCERALPAIVWNTAFFAVVRRGDTFAFAVRIATHAGDKIAEHLVRIADQDPDVKRKITRVCAIDKPLNPSVPGFGASRDGRWIAWSQMDRQESDLMLLENFRS
jgi:hypothetical protein